jgi:hypothetical protein
MFDPDLGYYMRTLKKGWRLIAIAVVAGGVLGGATGILSSGADGWLAKQSIDVQKAAVSPVIGKVGFVNNTPLPDRKVATEAALMTELMKGLTPGASVVAVGNDAGSTLDVTSTGSDKAVVAAALTTSVEKYVANRTADYDKFLDVLAGAITAQKAAAEASLTSLDAQIGSEASGSPLASGLVAQRNELVALVDSTAGALDYLASFRSTQTGGVSPIGTAVIAPVSTSSRTVVKSAAKRGVALGLVAGVLACAWLLVRRTARRRFENAADLSLYTSVVSLGDIQSLGSGLLAHIPQEDATLGHMIVTQSFVGDKADDLRTAMQAFGVEAKVHACLSLPEISRAERVVIAVDRAHDDERSVEDLLLFLRERVSGPILAVLC